MASRRDWVLGLEVVVVPMEVPQTGQVSQIAAVESARRWVAGALRAVASQALAALAAQTVAALVAQVAQTAVPVVQLVVQLARQRPALLALPERLSAR